MEDRFLGSKDFENKTYICTCGAKFFGAYSFLAHLSIHHEYQYDFLRNILEQFKNFKEVENILLIMHTNK